MTNNEIRKKIDEIYKNACDQIRNQESSMYHALEGDSFEVGYHSGVRDVCAWLLTMIK